MRKGNGDTVKGSRELIVDILDKVRGGSDMDWAEIAQKHVPDMHPETLRKAGVGVRWAAEANMIAAEREQTYDETYRAKRQFYDQRREYNKLLTEEARAEHLAEYLAEAARKLNEEYPLERKSGYAWLRGNGKAEAVLVLTDWHLGMVTDNIWNRYDTEICRQRVQNLITLATERLSRHNVGKLHVFVLGDMANGAIHVSSRVASEEDVCDQLMQVSEMIAQVVSQLADVTEAVQVYCTYGNHMRTVQSARDSLHSDNMEKIIPWWLKQRFKGRSDVTIMENGRHELLRAVVCGYEVCGVHGDLDFGKDRLLVLDQLYRKTFGMKMNYLFSGHFHSAENTESLGMEAIRSGSLCGTDEFAKNKRLFSDPKQTLAIFESDYGLDAVYHLRVGGGE